MPSLLKAEQAQLPQPVFIGEVLQPSDHGHTLPLDPLQELYISLVWETPGLDTVLQLLHQENRVEGETPSDAAQNIVDLPVRKCSLLAHVKFFIDWDSYILVDPSCFSSMNHPTTSL